MKKKTKGQERRLATRPKLVLPVDVIILLLKKKAGPTQESGYSLLGILHSLETGTSTQKMKIKVREKTKVL